MWFDPNEANDLAPQIPKGIRFGTILADPPWQFQNRTGKVAPEHKRLNRYGTMTLDEIRALPVEDIAADPAHLYLWVPNALLPHFFWKEIELHPHFKLKAKIDKLF